MTARDNIINRLEQDILGPLYEKETLYSYPTDVYLTGILYPQQSDLSHDDRDQLKAEGYVDKDSNDVSNDEISLATVKRPSSAGLSFMVHNSEDTPSIDIEIRAGIYQIMDKNGLTDNHSADKLTLDDNEVNNSQDILNSSTKKKWKRIHIVRQIDNISLKKNYLDINDSETGVPGLQLHIRCSQNDGKLLVTVAMVNSNRTDKDNYERSEYEEKCFFQTALFVSCSGNTRFHPRPIKASAVDEDTRMASLIYRNVNEYAVGHTCSAGWNENDGMISTVFTDWLPRTTVPMMSSSGIDKFKNLSEVSSGPILSAKWLSENRDEELIAGLRQLPELYRNWLKEENQRIPSLDSELQDQAKRHIENAWKVSDRIMSAIDLISRDRQVQIAFRLANRAIMLQRTWTSQEDNDLVWRPFQLGFILLSLSSTALDEHPDRNTADLLWFPTGGGKTEAYLGLIAFVLFLRRLKYGNQGAGVACIMRYTLRLLTIQQFQRAAAMICACNALYHEADLPGDLRTFSKQVIPFSLGLWVGGEATPNKFVDSAEALRQDSYLGRPDQLKFCPKHPDKLLKWIADPVRNETRCYCTEQSCQWSEDTSGLPIWTVDEDVYREKPSLVIGTIDKFAQIARKKESAALFGLENYLRRPDLIIQDELHLISGPLGTMTGLYEIAIDELCSHGMVRPKIIASTATIRQASSQIRSLFNRNTCLFPPPVIDAENSGFAVIDREASGRKYIGITTAGRSAKFTLQAVSASLMQSVASNNVEVNWKDLYWTLVTYFNSLRELGGALVLMQDDVTYSLGDFAKRHDEIQRKISEPVELTSRVSSSDIKEILDRLSVKYPNKGTCDVLLASNMISVGVDVPRLGLMVVNGQPKGIAEYIQATSRVGRQSSGPGGIIATIYNNAKARDRSHFETFRTWHDALYREVEASSVTPFAPRAREKALHAVLVILARHLIPIYQENLSDVDQHEDKLDNLIEDIIERSESIDDEETENVEQHLRMFLEKWINSSGTYEQYWNDYKPRTSLLISAEKAAEIIARRGAFDGRAHPTPNSMRNVEPGTMFKLKEKL